MERSYSLSLSGKQVIIYQVQQGRRDAVASIDLTSSFPGFRGTLLSLKDKKVYVDNKGLDVALDRLVPKMSQSPHLKALNQLAHKVHHDGSKLEAVLNASRLVREIERLEGELTAKHAIEWDADDQQALLELTLRRAELGELADVIDDEAFSRLVVAIAGEIDGLFRLQEVVGQQRESIGREFDRRVGDERLHLLREELMTKAQDRGFIAQALGQAEAFIGTVREIEAGIKEHTIGDGHDLARLRLLWHQAERYTDPRMQAIVQDLREQIAGLEKGYVEGRFKAEVGEDPWLAPFIEEGVRVASSPPLLDKVLEDARAFGEILDDLKAFSQSIDERAPKHGAFDPAEVKGIGAEFKPIYDRHVVALREIAGRYPQLDLFGIYADTLGPILKMGTILPVREQVMRLAASMGQAITGAGQVPAHLSGTAGSAQDVYVHAEQRAVLKKMTPRAADEEETLSQLMMLAGVGQVVPAMMAKKMTHREVPFSERQRGYEDRNLDPLLVDGIKRKMSRAVGETYLAANGLFTGAGARPYFVPLVEEREEAYTYAEGGVYLVDGEADPIPFKELQARYLRGTLRAEAQVQRIGLGSVVQLKDDKSLIAALGEKGQPKWAKRRRWRVKDIGGWTELSFRDLKARFSKGQLPATTWVQAMQRGEVRRWKKMKRLRNALETPWTYELPQLIAKGTWGTERVEAVWAKGYRQEMLLNNRLRSDPDLHEAVIDRLTPESEFTREMTSEFQMMDLHGNNLGYAPVEAPARVALRDYTYSYSLDDGTARHGVSLERVTKDFLRGLIADIGTVQADQPIDPALLAQLPGVVDGPWEYVLFDLDLSMGEGNDLRTHSGRVNVPLRSCLFKGGEGAIPYSEATLARLRAFDRDFDEVMIPWINRWDTPLRQALTPAQNRELDTLLEPSLAEDQYSLAKSRRGLGRTTVNNGTLQKRFGETAKNGAQYQPIWQFLKEHLPDEWYLSERVVRGETLEDIAARHRILPDTLRFLNFDLLAAHNVGKPHGQWELPVGERLKVRYDLDDPDGIAVEERKALARQLFPRLTHGQRTALVERQTRRRDYLAAYKALAGAKPANRMQAMRVFLARSDLPLDVVELEEFRQQLAVDQFQHLVDRCAPTYENLARVKYPLLANTYRLLEEMEGADTAATSIGHFRVNLGVDVVAPARAYPYSLDPTVQTLADALEQGIALHRNGAFYHY